MLIYSDRTSTTTPVDQTWLGDEYQPSVTVPKCDVKYCWERLPCGICRRTDQPCPYGGYDKWEITC